MTMPMIAQRVFDTPLLVAPAKAAAFVAGLGPRLLTGRLELEAPGVEPEGTVAVGRLAPRASILAGEVEDRHRRAGRTLYAVRDGVALIEVAGTLVHRGAWLGQSSGVTSYEGIAAQVAAAAEDPAVRGIALEIDSFGGEVAGVFDLADTIRTARARKPVQAFVAEALDVIRFTEFGCPAVDRGSNQPNVFFDPKSSESFLPHFSRGWRDDAIQRAYLEATLLYWQEPGRNPVSAVYGGPMIDMAEAAAWTWDARPYPFFPALGAVWSDGGNWRLGHWLTGGWASSPSTSGPVRSGAGTTATRSGSTCSSRWRASRTRPSSPAPTASRSAPPPAGRSCRPERPSSSPPAAGA